LCVNKGVQYRAATSSPSAHGHSSDRAVVTTPVPMCHVERVRNLRPHERNATSVKPRPVGQDTASTRVQIVERLSRVTLSIYWSDARTGLYADQRWRLGRARIRSFCVLTGAPIQVGDPIYRPKSNNPDSPGNRDFMILAATVVNEFGEH
jgi:Domain of unknown function (DUF3331)